MAVKKDRPRGSFIRMCSGCGQRMNKYGMIRICAADGNVFIDESGNRDGRGAYICNKRECFEKLKKSKRLPRLLRCGVDESVYVELEKKIDG